MDIDQITSETLARIKRSSRKSRPSNYRKKLMPSFLMGHDLNSGALPGAMNAKSHNKSKPLSKAHKKGISRSLRANWLVTAPDGTKHHVSNLKKFASKNGLNYKCLCDTHQGA
jgi:hypothetical protein